MSETIDQTTADEQSTQATEPAAVAETTETVIETTAAAEPTAAPATAPAEVSAIITPTIGRRVHFYPNGSQFHSKPFEIQQPQGPAVPMDAGIVFVWDDRMVNLHVADHIGQVHALTSIKLRQPGDAIPTGAYCEWMPYQVATASK